MVTALALATSTVHAAPLTDRADAEGERLVREAEEIEATRPRGAAELRSKAAESWASILAAKPEAQEHQQLRESAYCKASRELLRAHELDPEPALIDRGAKLSQDYLAARKRVYGATPPTPAYCDPDARAAEFAHLRPALVVSAQERVEPKPPEPRRWPVIGMWSALGLTVGFGAAALGTSIALRYDRNHPTDRSKWGPVFTDIQNAVANHPDINQSKNRHLCQYEFRRQVDALKEPCRTSDARVATTVLFAAAAVTTAVFAGLVLRDRARARRGDRPAIVAGPTQGGVFVQLRLRF